MDLKCRFILNHRRHEQPSFLISDTEVLNIKIDKMSLIRNWHTEIIDQENLNFSSFSNGVR